MTKAAVYVRISQDREGAGLGVQRQQDDCRDLAERLGLTVAEVYCDNDVSAYSGKPRPEYARLLKDVRAGRIDAVIVWHTDRLHRSTAELETYIDVAGGIPTHTVTAGLLDLSTASGRMTARITGAVARHESEHKSERQRRKADELAKAGKPLGGGRPFGYESDGITIRESEAEELRGMVRRVLAGDSLRSIMADLNRRGVTTTRGGTWGYTSTRELCMRQRNCGRMVHRGKVIGMASWEPIVSETDHDAVTAILMNPARRTTTTSARKHLLSGLVLCVCGSPMHASSVTSRGKRYEVYRCTYAQKHPGEKGHMYRNRERVDAYVTERVLRQLTAISRPQDDGATARLEFERGEIAQRLQESALMYAGGRISADLLAAASEALNARLSVITDELSAATPNVFGDLESMDETDWNSLTLERKRRIIEALMVITIEPVQHGPLTGRAGVAIKLRSDKTPGIRTTKFGFTMPTEIATKVRSAAG